MDCPNCNRPTYIYTCKHDRDKTFMRRNRKCKICGWHVTTFELQENFLEDIAGKDEVQLLRDEIQGNIIAQEMKRMAYGL